MSELGILVPIWDARQSRDEVKRINGQSCSVGLVGFLYLNVPVDDNEFGSIVYGWQVDHFWKSRKGIIMKFFLKKLYQGKKFPRCSYVARRIGIMPC